MQYDVKKTISNFSKALTYKTVSHSKTEEFDFSEFSAFIDFLKTTYTNVNKVFDLEIVNDYGLLFHWKSGSSAKPIMFLAHYDVVPINEGAWRVDPFSGIEEDGKLWGRGTIDDKNSVIALMETFEKLIDEGFKPKKDIYLAFGYDEEVLGNRGAVKIAEHLKGKGITFDCILDEGGIVTSGKAMGIDEDIALIGVAEKSQCNYELIFKGEQGHSSSPGKNTAIAKMSAFVVDVENHPSEIRLVKPVEDLFVNLSDKKTGLTKMIMRNPSRYFGLIKKSLVKGRQTNALIRTTVAFTMASSGTAPNVLPDEAKLIANVRLLQGDTPEKIEAWLKSFGHDFELKPLHREHPSKISDIKTESYQLLKETIREVFGDMMISSYLMIGGTDSRHYSELSDSIYRFMPCRLSADELNLMHADDEYISIENFMRMIDFYDKFVKKVAG